MSLEIFFLFFLNFAFLNPILHELAHAGMAIFFGYKINFIKLGSPVVFNSRHLKLAPFFIVSYTNFDNIDDIRPRDFMWIAMAGPFVDISLFLLFFITINSSCHIGSDGFFMALCASFINLMAFLININILIPGSDGHQTWKAYLKIK